MRPDANSIEKHIPVLGYLYIVFNIVGLLFGVLVWVVFAFVATLPSVYREDAMVIHLLGMAVVIFSVVLSAPGIIGGFGLLRRKNWARITLIILGFLNLINLPFGTALGIYTLWVLLREESAQFFT